MFPDVVQGVLIDGQYVGLPYFRQTRQFHVGDELRQWHQFPSATAADYLNDRYLGSWLDQLDNVAQQVQVVLDGVRGLGAGAGAGEAALCIVG